MRLEATPDSLQTALKPFAGSGLRRFGSRRRNQESWTRPDAYTLIDGSDDHGPVGPETLGGSNRNRLVRRRFSAKPRPRDLGSRGGANRARRSDSSGSFSMTRRGLKVEV